MLNRLPLPLFGIGLALLYSGERLLNDMPRYVCDGAALLFVLAALGLATWRWQKSRAERRRAHLWVIAAYLVTLVGLVIYGFQTEELALVNLPKTRVILQVLWPALVLLGLTPAVAMELAIGSMAQTPTLEIGRVRLASRAARIISLAVIAFAGLNFTAASWNRHIDLSYFKTTRVGSATENIVQNLTQPVTFTLFFPPSNETLELTRAYVDELARHSDKITVEVTDQALEPEKARELKVRQNGYLVIQSGRKSESLRIDPDVDEAHETLRGLDGEVQKRLLKVIRPDRLAYFTTGHGERDYAPPLDDKRPGLGDFKGLLESQGFLVRRLGLGEGLGTDIPHDATLVMVMGPQEPFTPPERDAIRRYLERGGRVLFAMDPDHGTTDDALLAPLGVKVSKNLVSNEKFLVHLEGNRQSPYDLATNRATAHPAVATIEQFSQRFWLVLLGAGHITKVDPVAADLNVTFLVHAMPQSWEDKNGNGKFDAGAETRGNFEFAAAIEKHFKGANPDKDSGAKPASNANDASIAPNDAKTGDSNKQANHAADKAKQDAPSSASAQADDNKLPAHPSEPPPPMRAVVLADADFAANGVIRNPGNAYVLADNVRWLAGDEKEAGIVESERDVPILHRKEDDALWFYGASFLAPATVLIGGLMFTRRSGRSRRSR